MSIGQKKRSLLRGKYLSDNPTKYFNVLLCIHRMVGGMRHFYEGWGLRKIGERLQSIEDVPNGLTDGTWDAASEMFDIFNMHSDRWIEDLAFLNRLDQLSLPEDNREFFASIPKKFADMLEQLDKIVDGLWLMCVATNVVGERRKERAQDAERKREYREWLDEQLLTKLRPVS